VARKIFWGSLALTPAVLLVRYGLGIEGTAVFVLAAAALAPLAFLIGEATENVAEHTGPGIGAFLNASFGNAPELIIAVFAIGSNLPNVVRGSITGSVVSTSLLVLGGSMVAAGRDCVLDRRSLLVQVGTILLAVALFLIPSIPGWHGDPDRHSLYVLTVPISVVLIAVYVVVTIKNLGVHNTAQRTAPRLGAWDLRTGIAVLCAATVATALVSEVLVHSLTSFGHALGLSDFFVAAVIVALVGNAAEQGGAIVISRHGNPALGAEIAISSATQIAAFVAPAVALLSFLFGHDLPLSFRPVEIGALGIGAIVVTATVVDGKSRPREGYLLLALYACAVVAFALSGDR
jgi:Ca2+:H+ antiporter